MKQAVLAIFASLILTATAMASPVGVLNVTNCTGGGVTVTATTITWLMAVTASAGCIASDTGTSVTYTGGGPLLSGDTTGQIMNLTAATPNPLLNFIFFTDQPNLHFDLNTIGPGVTSTACSATLNANNPACSPFSGSPVILTPTATGTTATLSAFGTARDSSASNSAWLGQFTTQFPGITPAQLQSAIVSNTTITGFCSGGSCTSTYSGSFTVTATAVPEPMSLLLIGGGLIGLAFLKRSKVRA